MLSPYQLQLAVQRLKPCSWCGASAGEPCRAQRGKGKPLEFAVHTPRSKLPPPPGAPGSAPSTKDG